MSALTISATQNAQQMMTVQILTLQPETDAHQTAIVLFVRINQTVEKEWSVTPQWLSDHAFNVLRMPIALIMQMEKFALKRTLTAFNVK